MSLSSALASTSRSALTAIATRRMTPTLTVTLPQTRSVSSSPYGRTHVWKHRQRKLPNPCVPVFPQRVVRADGSSYVHYTTSPRSVFHLTRDTTNNPLWNVSRLSAEGEEEDALTGRLGRFNRKFDRMGGHDSDMDWMFESKGAVEAAKAVKEVVADVAKKGGKR